MKRISIYLVMLFASIAFTANSQIISLNNPVGATVLLDTVVNTATAFLTCRNNGAHATTTIQVVATKISGTVAGTISLLGSLDGVNFKALTVAEASTAINTFTATDVASQTFIWRINFNPCVYYRVSWTGTGTMSASFTAKLLPH